jgi:hypothetical protein
MFEAFLKARGIEILEKKSHGLIVRIGKIKNDIFIPESLIASYEVLQPSFENFEPFPAAGTLASPNYVEQALMPVGDLSARRFILRSDESRPSYQLKFGNDDEMGMCQITRCSDLFYWRFVLPNIDVETLDTFFYGLSSSPTPITRAIPKPLTARVHNLEASSIQEAVVKSQSIIQSLLFNSAFLYDLTLEATNDIAVTRRRIRRRYRTSPRVPEHELRVPAGQFNPDLVRFTFAPLQTLTR